MNETEALLQQLRGINPPAVSQLPAPGWWLLGLVLAVLLFVAWRVMRQYQQRAWTREARRELAEIQQQAASVPAAQSLAAVSRLARRVVLAVRPRDAVASLHGDRWLSELDTLCGRDVFSHSYGQMLKDAQYQRAPDIRSADLQGLFDVIEELIGAVGKKSKSRVVRK
ncbi:MAG: DUF4381 domain-containing protein [Granulosicoccus sp.]